MEERRGHIDFITGKKQVVHDNAKGSYSAMGQLEYPGQWLCWYDAEFLQRFLF
jgi:hypothetical protein